MRLERKVQVQSLPQQRHECAQKIWKERLLSATKQVHGEIAEQRSVWRFWRQYENERWLLS